MKKFKIIPLSERKASQIREAQKDDNSEHLLGYLRAETNFACPQIVLAVYDKSGNYIDADVYTKRAFYTATRSEGVLSINHAYIIRTRFMVYFIDLRKGTSNH